MHSHRTRPLNLFLLCCLTELSNSSWNLHSISVRFSFWVTGSISLRVTGRLNVMFKGIVIVKVTRRVRFKATYNVGVIGNFSFMTIGEC